MTNYCINALSFISNENDLVVFFLLFWQLILYLILLLKKGRTIIL